LVDPLAEQVTNANFRTTFKGLAEALMAQDNRDIVVPVNPNIGTATSRVRDFNRMKPLEF